MRVLVIHFETAEAARLAERLRRDGIDCEPYPHVGLSRIGRIRENPPDAILIDLSRMPSYGRIMGAELRKQKGTRAIPLVFLEGDPEKTQRVRDWLPDATFTTLPEAGKALAKALKQSAEMPAPPQVERNAAAIKLGIAADSVVALLHAPDGFVLEGLPSGAHLQAAAAGADILLLFAKSIAALSRQLPAARLRVEAGSRLWVVWPKRASGAGGDLTAPGIVECCRAIGLSAYKTCAIDETWSACAVGRSGRKRRSVSPVRP